ncbi:transferrin-binding protein-like solute binding protein [Shimia sagamensis]|uniref:transferrin-binding protein-like solute binding protein n=1 Tax=Shimia sagamensis TaxID=1566352 RepID=UPI003D295BBE
MTTDLVGTNGSRHNSSLNFSGTGNVDGSGIRANLTSSSGSGTATGSFYGSNAEELGATFGIDGSSGAHVGSFGASR